MSKSGGVIYSSIEEFVARGPMDRPPFQVCLLKKVDGVEVSAVSRGDCRGLAITIEVELDEFFKLAFDRSFAT